MNLTRLALLTAGVACALWSAKAVAIGIAGGLGRSPAEGPLFLLGLVACVVAAAVTGMAVAHRRTTGGQVLAAVAGIVVAALYGTLEGALVSALQPAHPGWVWGEVNLWVLALTVLGVAATAHLRRGARAVPAPAPDRNLTTGSR
jgi:hypothetical protein